MRKRHHYYQYKYLRGKILEASSAAGEVIQAENRLVEILCEIDLHRIYVPLGYNALRTYCIYGLGISRTQAQRLVTAARRRSETTSHVRQENYLLPSGPRQRPQKETSQRKIIPPAWPVNINCGGADSKRLF